MANPEDERPEPRTGKADETAPATPGAVDPEPAAPSATDPRQEAPGDAAGGEETGAPTEGKRPAAEADLEADAEAAEKAGEDAGQDEGSDESGPGEDPKAAATGKAREGASRKARAKQELSAVPPERLMGAVEALLLASGDVLSVERLRDLLGLTSVVHVREAVEAIRERWTEAEVAVEIQEVAGGVRAATRPEYAEYVRRLSRRPESDKLSPSLLETLSIVAYRQPVPRVEVERIRGVQCGDALRGLLERRLLKVAGRSDQPGRPLLYGTTKRFLEVFGLRSLKDLPAKGDLKRL